MAKLCPIFNQMIEINEQLPLTTEDRERACRSLLMCLMVYVIASLRLPLNRITGFARDCLSDYRDYEFLVLYRLCKRTAQRFISELRSAVEVHSVTHLRKRKLPGGRPQVPLETKALMFLWYMASNCDYNKLATVFGVAESTACQCVHAILDIMNVHLLEKIIKWPTQQEAQDIADICYRTNGFPGVIGFIDGTHIPIIQPNIRGQDYYNRKDFYSIILQGVVREDLRFISVYTGWPGRVHDARVFAASPLAEYGEGQCAEYHMLGDAAYPCLPWLLTPFKKPTGQHLTVEQQRLNNAHSALRVNVERAFGQLKGRFKRLRPLHQHDIAEMNRTIIAACILHNICIMSDDEFDAALENDDDNPGAGNHDEQNNYNNALFPERDRLLGKRKRDNIAHELNNR